MNNIILELMEFVSNTPSEDMNYGIALYILLNAKKLETLSSEQIAEACFVSQASITRFAKSFGYNGYQSFKLQFLKARDFLTIIKPRTLNIIDINTDSKKIADDYYDNLIQALTKTKELLNSKELFRVAEQLTRSKRVVICGSHIHREAAKPLLALFWFEGKFVKAFDGDTRDFEKYLSKDTTIMIFSSSGQWLKNHQKEIEMIRAGKCKKFWFTCTDEIENYKVFDSIIKIGEESTSNINNYSVISVIEILEAYFQKINNKETFLR